MSKHNDPAFYEESECWFCTSPCVEGDYCRGCECFICPTCCEVSAEDLGRNHEPDEHQTELSDF